MISFDGCSFPPLSYPLPIRSRSSSYLSCLHPLPTSSPGAKRRPPGRCPHPPPASLRCSSLLPDPHACVCRRLPCRFVTPFSAFGLHPGPCWPLGGVPVAGPSESLCTWLVLPEFSSKPWHCLVLGVSQVIFFEKARGQGASTSWNSCALVLAPPATWPFQRHSGYI